MRNPFDWSLLHGFVPALLTVFGGCAIAYLVARRRRHWYSRTVPIVLSCSVAVALLAWWLVVYVWHPFSGPLPVTVITWTGFAVAGLGLGLARMRSSRWRVRLLTGCAVVVVVLMSLNHVNTFFGYYPNLRDALGLSFNNEISSAQAAALGGTHDSPSETASTSSQRPTRSLLTAWKPPKDLPQNGKVVEVDIPGTLSKFQARAAWLYLPPAYLVKNRPLLPVLELIGGQPGDSRDWLNGNDLAGVMDRFAADHHGLAPVVVMPDALGSFWGNPLCINSRLGQADTYLSVDVPNWARANLHINPDTRTWAVGGGSFGGTCAWQLAVFHPRTFPTFLDFSGVYEQLEGTLQDTINAAFGGNARKFAEVNPAQILIHHKRPELWATLGVGASDTYYVKQIESTSKLCRRAGIHVRLIKVPGGHDGQMFATLLTNSMRWLGQRDGILKS